MPPLPPNLYSASAVAGDLPGGLVPLITNHEASRRNSFRGRRHRLALQLGEEAVDPRAGDRGVLLAGAAADAHAGDDLPLDGHGDAAQKARQLAAARGGGVLEAEVEQQ